jgi:hypothetical protein
MNTVIYGNEAAVKDNVGFGWWKEPSIAYYGGSGSVNILFVSSVGRNREAVQIINHF